MLVIGILEDSKLLWKVTCIETLMVTLRTTRVATIHPCCWASKGQRQVVCVYQGYFGCKTMTSIIAICEINALDGDVEGHEEGGCRLYDNTEDALSKTGFKGGSVYVNCLIMFTGYKTCWGGKKDNTRWCNHMNCYLLIVKWAHGRGRESLVIEKHMFPITIHVFTISEFEQLQFLDICDPWGIP